jgi:hypothetical protein
MSNISPGRRRRLSPHGSTCHREQVSADNAAAGPGDVDPRIALRDSARGWHGAQLAVIGFIGLCGVLTRSAAAAAPHWLQVLALVLVLAGLVCACLGVALVSSVAWPLSTPAIAAHDADGGKVALEEWVAAATRRLRAGVLVSFVSVALVATAATSGWWPRPAPAQAEPASVQVTAATGTWCGALASSPSGSLAVRTSAGVVAVALADLQSVQPVTACAQTG